MNKYYVTQQTYNYNVSSLTIQMYWHEDENGNKVDIFFRTQTDKSYMPIREDSIYKGHQLRKLVTLVMR